MNQRKEKAIALRKKGFSYNMISEKLGVGKSTLSCWFREMPFTPNNVVLKRIQLGPIKSGKIRHNRRVKDIQRIKNLSNKELGNISERDLWMLGLGLYIGEGSKAYEIVRIINSDSKVIRLAIKWLKNVCKVKNDNFSIMIFLYPDNDVNKCVRYWSGITGIPVEQFRETQIDKRKNKSSKKRKKLPYGTAHLSIVSKGNPDFGVNLHRRIMGWIESSLKQV